MRFFARTPADTDGKTGNLVPGQYISVRLEHAMLIGSGTVVDTGVTDPYLFDFYLQVRRGY